MLLWLAIFDKKEKENKYEKDHRSAPRARDGVRSRAFDNDSTPFDVSTLTEEEIGKIKVGFIFLHDETSTYDLNFMNAAREACTGLGMVEGEDFLIKTNIPEGQECYDAACELVDAGCNIIFADSFGHESYMIQAAREFPDVQFCHATGTHAHAEGLSNYHNAFASIYEGRYLAGIAAGMKLNQLIDEGKLRFVELYDEEYDRERLVRRLKKEDPIAIYRNGRDMGNAMAGYKKYLFQVLRIYNGCSQKQALPIKF